MTASLTTALFRRKGLGWTTRMVAPNLLVIEAANTLWSLEMAIEDLRSWTDPTRWVSIFSGETEAGKALWVFEYLEDNE